MAAVAAVAVADVAAVAVAAAVVAAVAVAAAMAAAAMAAGPWAGPFFQTRGYAPHMRQAFSEATSLDINFPGGLFPFDLFYIVFRSLLLIHSRSCSQLFSLCYVFVILVTF